LARDSRTSEQVLAVLAATPVQLAALATGVESARLHTASEHDEWSANDVLAHLRACADVWGDCIVAITTRDNPTLRAVNPRTWINTTDYPQQSFQPSLQTFTAQRTGLLAVLEPLSPAGWARTARVTGAGRVLELSVLDYARRLARHERQHVRQIDRMLSTGRS
jgi:hypothetical protein